MSNNLLLRVILPIELENGNKGRSGKWFSSAKLRKQYEATFRALKLTRQPFDEPVTVKVTRYLKPRQSKWDTSSCGRGNYKEIEDALVAVGWFTDDSYKWIRDTRFTQDDTCRDVPQLAGMTMVEVYEYEPEKVNHLTE